jgi:hypothetical protein
VYIVYVITTTTTTTTTPITAPILAANGPITWIPGSQLTGASDPPASAPTGPSTTGGAMSCSPIPGTTSLVCSLVGSGSRTTGTAGRTRLKLSCTVASPKTTAKRTTKRHKSKSKTQRKRPSHHSESTHAPRKVRTTKTQLTMLCNSV